MKGLKNIGILFVIALILTCAMPATGSNSVRCNNSNSSAKDEIVQSPEIQNPVQPVYLGIKGNSFATGITEIHKFVSLVILSNHIVPLNFDFRRTKYIPVLINFDSPVSIFIKGHALLN